MIGHIFVDPPLIQILFSFYPIDPFLLYDNQNSKHLF